MIRHRLTHCLLALAVLSSVSACATDRLSPAQEPSVREATTGEASLALDAADHFTFGTPVQAQGGPAELSEQQARQVARAWAVSLAPMVRASLEAEHGDTIAFASLVPCRRTLYAKSPYLPPEPGVAGTAGGAVFLRGFGSYWLVSLCDAGGRPNVLLAVSVFATDVKVAGDQLEMPSVGGEWFHWQGVPAIQTSETTVGPERAAITAYQLSGKRVRAVPDLIIPAKADGFPYDARWRVSLEGDTTITVSASGQRRSTHEVFVGWSVRTEGEDVLVPAAVQPDGLPFRYPTNLGSATRATLAYADGFLKRDPSIPVVMEGVATETARGLPR